MSTEERRVQLVTEVDNRAVRPGFNQITREAGAMADAVPERSRRAENAVGGIGGGATRSATQVEAAGRNLIGSIGKEVSLPRAANNGEKL